jgi:antitoxin CptB
MAEPAASASAAPAPALPPLDARRLARLRWRCRRGMLENDLLLTRFLDRRGAALGEADVAALDRLLDLPDGELWDVLCRRPGPSTARHATGVGLSSLTPYFDPEDAP